ncbi:M50 family peptidase [Aeromicrobium phragmitis]|uniref:M50 family peptidase n=1 Tax=Aeromicrobium phragmitis TaxID=2478914 RepID=A0A3L8PPA9_9ACTN|nr:M50 family metallopeptidase [Aeromicrobium phragmitis]RLV55842.1 M50 family peptidase [Aeromicrobium phragmitis]
MEPAWIGAAVAALAVLVPGAWRYSRQVVTVMHEAGHAVTAVLTGRRVRAVRLHRDTSGITESIGRPSGLGMVATAFAGYTFAPVLGAFMMLLVLAGRSAWAWWLVLGILGAMILLIRTWFGLLVLVPAAAAVWLLQTRAPDPAWAETAGFAAAWFLAAGGLRATLELWGHRRRTRARTSDADVLARLTVLPAAVWNALFATVAALSLYVCWLGVMGH